MGVLSRSRETTNMIDTVLVLVFSVASCLAQDAGLDYVDDFSCPDELEGYYPHLYSCDKYWACTDGLAELKTCGNGLAFIDTDESYKLEQCEELHLVECGRGRSWSPPSPPPTVHGCGGRSLTPRPAEGSGSVRTGRPTGTSIHPASPTTRSPTAASGSARSQTAPAILLSLTRTRSSCVPRGRRKALSPSTRIPWTAGSSSCA